MKRLDLRGLTGATFQAVAGAVSLALLLLYTFAHTGALLARYINPDAFGYLAAAGIELAIVSLSLRIGELRRNGRGAWGFYAVLVAVLAVSALANVAEGFATMHGALLTTETVRNVDALQAVIGVAATGLLSVIVLALSEIIGSDVRRAAQVAERMERKERRAETEVAEPASDGAFTTQVIPLSEAQRGGLTTNVLALPGLDTLPFRCACGAAFAKQQSLAGHQKRCAAWQENKRKEATG